MSGPSVTAGVVQAGLKRDRTTALRQVAGARSGRGRLLSWTTSRSATRDFCFGTNRGLWGPLADDSSVTGADDERWRGRTSSAAAATVCRREVPRSHRADRASRADLPVQSRYAPSEYDFRDVFPTWVSARAPSSTHALSTEASAAGRGRGELMAAAGENPMAVDSGARFGRASSPVSSAQRPRVGSSYGSLLISRPWVGSS
jgi:hypothetical protein